MESIAEVDALPQHDGAVALAQTTLSHRDWEGVAVRVKERFPMCGPRDEATCASQPLTVKVRFAMAERCDAIVVIGSANSSNTTALARLATDAGCQHVVRVNTAEELTDDLQGVVGVTAGASAPEQLVREVLERLAPTNGIELVRVTEEDEYFPPPRNIRELQAAIESAATVLLGGGVLTSPKMDDRSLSASAVLASLDEVIQ